MALPKPVKTEKAKEPDRNMQRKTLQGLATVLLEKRDEAVKFRASSGVERRWREDQTAFDTLDDIGKQSMIDYATGEASRGHGGGSTRSRAIVNVLRSKCEIAEGRFSDVLLPTDERNWGLKTTPVPELVKGMDDDRPVINTQTNEPLAHPDGTPAKTAEVAKAQADAATEKMKAMETVMDDQLTECNYNGECRKQVRDAVRSGTGVIKGPNVIKKIQKAWIPKSDGERTVHTLEVVEQSVPEAKRVDFWNVYPAPECGEDIVRSPYIWEVEDMLPRELINFIGVDGYFEDEIRAVLEEDPQRTQVGIGRGNKSYEIKKQALSKGTAFEKWEYHGDVSRDDLEALDCDCGDLEGQALSAVVVFVNDRPIKIQLNVLDTGDLGYDFFQWTQISGSPWGIGVVRIGIWQQRIIIASWRAMMDNGRDSAGANVVIGKGVEPGDGRWELTGKKIWRFTGTDPDVRKAFAQFKLTNNQAELEAIIELALKFLDMETNIPVLFQGEKGEMPETLGATNIMVDSNNVAFRDRVKLWDDNITMRLMTRFYHWNMQYNEDPDIKGDYNVSPKGTSVLLVRDQQAQSLIQLMALRGDPKVDNEVDWGKAVRELFKSLKLDVLKSEADKKADEEARKNQPPPADPKIEAAKIRSEGEMAKAQLNQSSDMTELELKAGMAEVERDHEMQMKQMDLQLKMMEFAESRDMKLSDIKADLSKEASKQNLMRELADKKTAELTSPPVEPVGKAPEGKAYTQ
jgi:hypothetical protein